MESYHPESVKKIPNRLLKCLECGDPVYAVYLCRKHYSARNKRSNAERKAIERDARKAAKLEAFKRYIEEHGSQCKISTCNALTIQETGLCKTHEGRANLWQFTAEELVLIYSEPSCRICQGTEWLVLDHQHGLDCEPNHRGSNGCPECFRGVLCNGCNTALGMMGDTPARLRAGAKYIEDSQRIPR